MKAGVHFAALLLLVTACSTTKVLQEGEYRLVSNKVTFTSGTELGTSDISPYIKQQMPGTFYIFGWNPFINVYNWSNGSGSLFDRMWRKIGQAPVVFNKSLVEPSCDNIINHLDYLGYYGSEVETQVSYKGRKAYVNYIITPGKRRIIDEITYELPRSKTFQDEFRSDIPNSLVRRGSFLSEDILEKETSRGTNHFRELGYYDFTAGKYSFRADTISVPGKTHLYYRLEADTLKHHFGKVTIMRSESLPFRDKVLTDMNVIHPGDCYSASAVNKTYSRLSALRVFNSVSIELSPSDSGLVDCNIQLTQTKDKGFKVNLEASSNSTGLVGFSPQLTFYHKNIFHGGEWLNLNFTGNFQSRLNDRSVHSNEAGISMSLSFPKMFGFPMRLFNGPYVPRTELNAAFNFQERPEFTRYIGSFSVGYSGYLADNRLIYRLFPLQINYVDLTDIDPVFNQTLNRNPYMKYSYQDHLDAGVGGTIYYKSTTELIPRIPYYFAMLNFDLSGNVLSAFKPLMATDENGNGMLLGAPFAQYVRGELSLGKTFRWGRENGQSLALHALAGAGYAYGNSSALPFEKQFYCGGASSLRGWQARTIGPGFSKQDGSFSIPSQTGDIKFELNAEYRFDLFWKLEGALFADAGNVWNSKDFDRDFLRSVAADWGLGIRANLDFILLRLDGGFKVHDPSADMGSRWIGPRGWFSSNGFAIHFGVGYPF
ncbi:MAG: BamA/TamA family outer membrane protein [Bacteroidales bacterium]|nr:BamA/TamA family outer membrane protein [Bacteroidales bacterium]